MSEINLTELLTPLIQMLINAEVIGSVCFKMFISLATVALRCNLGKMTSTKQGNQLKRHHIRTHKTKAPLLHSLLITH